MSRVFKIPFPVPFSVPFLVPSPDSGVADGAQSIFRSVPLPHPNPRFPKSQNPKILKSQNPKIPIPFFTFVSKLVRLKDVPKSTSSGVSRGVGTWWGCLDTADFLFPDLSELELFPGPGLLLVFLTFLLGLLMSSSELESSLELSSLSEDSEVVWWGFERLLLLLAPPPKKRRQIFFVKPWYY